MPQLAMQFIYVCAALVLLGIIGLSVVGSRSTRCPFVLFASPQAGLLVLTVATATTYSVFHLRLGSALVMAVPLCLVASAATLLTTRYKPSLKELGSFLVVAVLASGLSAWTNCAASIVSNAPSLLYVQGTDQLGYAHIADWIRDNAPSRQMSYKAVPRGDPSRPYESFPNIMLGDEPRLGAFVLLGIVGVLEGLPSSFAFDSACAIALCSAVLGVAAIFASRRSVLLALVLGLTAAQWFESQRAGFFGRAIAYPAILFTVGLFLVRRGDYRPWALAPLMVSAVGSAMLLSGYVTALFVLLLGLSAIGLDAIYSRRFDSQEVGVLGFMAAFAVAASGFLVRPYFGGFSGSIYDTFGTAVRALEIESSITPILTSPIAWGLFALVVAATALAVFLAFRARNGIALALILVPTAFLGIVLACGLRDMASALGGLLYPATLGGMAALIASPGLARAGRYAMPAAVLAMVITIGARVPRAVWDLARFTDRAVVAQRTLSLDEFDAIERAAKGQVVLVAVGPGGHLPIAALVELGRRGLDMQWTPDSWYWTVGGWRGWQVPRYERPAALRLVPRDSPAARGALVATRNFALVKNQPDVP